MQRDLNSEFWTDLAPFPHFPGGYSKTASKVAFVPLGRGYHRTVPIDYRPKLMEPLLLRGLDPSAVCNLLWGSEPTVTCALKKWTLVRKWRSLKLAVSPDICQLLHRSHAYQRQRSSLNPASFTGWETKGHRRLGSSHRVTPENMKGRDTALLLCLRSP